MKLLIIDDDHDLLMLAVLALGKYGGYKVFQAGNIEEGLAVAKENPPDGFVLDYNLNDLEGPEIVARLRSEPLLEEIPFIFLTAMTDSARVEQLRELGAKDVIFKPFNPMELADSVKKAFGF